VADARVERLWDLLTEAAAARTTITYTDAAIRVGGVARFMGGLLSPIRAHCLNLSLPRLDALVVRQSDRLPGSGHDGSADPMVDRRAVFAFDWTRVPNPYRIVTERSQ
jgi:hypothetical protein